MLSIVNYYMTKQNRKGSKIMWQLKNKYTTLTNFQKTKKNPQSGY